MTTSGATNFLVEGMNCGKCAARVTKAIQAQAPQAQVEVDLASKRVSVTPASPDPEALAQIITEAGYPARPDA